MGKHGGPGDNTAGTDSGDAFGKLSPEDKAAEFDASDSDPVGYAQRNFGASDDPAEINDARRRQGFDHR